MPFSFTLINVVFTSLSIKKHERWKISDSFDHMENLHGPFFHPSFPPYLLPSFVLLAALLKVNIYFLKSDLGFTYRYWAALIIVPVKGLDKDSKTNVYGSTACCKVVGSTMVFNLFKAL